MIIFACEESFMVQVRQNRPCLERVYVKVTSGFDETGYMEPKSITWKDGRTFAIETVLDFRPASSILGRTSPCRDCYTVLINGQEKHLFFEHTDPRFAGRLGRWFVEVPAWK